jgi:uncharacterized membrane protein (UPF0127 family)
VPITLRLSTGELLADHVAWTRGPLQRARGLIASDPPARGECLIFERAAQVHTCGVRYAIDVLFCDKDWIVLHAVRAMVPWRVSRWVRGSRYVVELPSGTLDESVHAGARLVLEDDSAPPR